MKIQTKQPEVAQTIQPKANSQAKLNTILQAYKSRFVSSHSNSERQTQLQSKSGNNVLQKVDASEEWKLEKAFQYAKEVGSVQAYYQALDHYGYPNENDMSDEPFDPTMQFKRNESIQLARSPHAISGPKSYNSHKHGALNNILYQCDGSGNIDFSQPKQYTLTNPYPGINPVEPASTVDVTTAVNAYKKDNRYQHFKEANLKAPAFGGMNGSSPANLTWHHLTTKHQMHLVDRMVHSKHGHNGGVYLW